MKIYRGFIERGVPIQVAYIENSTDLETIASKIKAAIGKFVVGMKIDKNENVEFLKNIAKTYKSNSNVWIAIKVDEGSEDLKIEKLLHAYDVIRRETKATIVIEVMRSDGACGGMIAQRKELVDVFFSMPFEKKQSVEHSINAHLNKLKEIEMSCKISTITYFPKSVRAPVGGCNACRAPGLNEMKRLIEGLRADEEEKKRLLKALAMMPVKSEEEGDEEHLRAMLEALNESGYSWYTEQEDALFEGCFREAS